MVETDVMAWAWQVCEHCSVAVVPHVGTILTALYTHCIARAFPTGTHCAADNACAAVARLVLALRTVVPLRDIAPTLLRGLPLREDYAENCVVYRCVDVLVREHYDVVAPHLPQVLGAMAHASQADPHGRAQLTDGMCVCTMCMLCMLRIMCAYAIVWYVLVCACVYDVHDVMCAYVIVWSTYMCACACVYDVSFYDVSFYDVSYVCVLHMVCGVLSHMCVFVRVCMICLSMVCRVCLWYIYVDV